MRYLFAANEKIYLTQSMISFILMTTESMSEIE